MIHAFAHTCFGLVSNSSARAILALVLSTCLVRKIRITPLRLRILELVVHAGRPIKAYELLDQLRIERGRADPPTVYRTLDFLVKHGLVHKVSASSTYVLCQRPGEIHCAPLLVCRQCGGVTELRDEDVSRVIRSQAQARGFLPTESSLEIQGVCSTCRESDH